MTDYSPANVSIENGYEYDATSDGWKDFCDWIPCFGALEWPGYATKVIHVTINGEDAVIQCWKGLCEEFIPEYTSKKYGKLSFPGGFGAEVGIYRIDSTFTKEQLPPVESVYGRAEAHWPPPLRRPASAWTNRRISHMEHAIEDHFWFPAGDLVTEPVSFTLFDPLIEQPLIADYSTSTYWTCKWMRFRSFWEWARASRPEIPVGESEIPHLTMPDRYDLKFTVAGVDYEWLGSSDIEKVPPKGT